MKAKGFEFEATAAPAKGLTIGGSLSYTETTFTDVNPVLITQAGGDYQPALRAPWTGGLWGQYETAARVRRCHADVPHGWQLAFTFLADAEPRHADPCFSSFNTVAPSWMVNARVALRNIAIGGAKAELAGWVRNLTQNREIAFGNQTLRFLGSANYVPARTFGADLTFDF